MRSGANTTTKLNVLFIRKPCSDTGVICPQEGSTLLHAAAEAGDTRILELVLKCGGQPHRQDHNGAIPLHYAAARGTCWLGC